MEGCFGQALPGKGSTGQQRQPALVLLAIATAEYCNGAVLVKPYVLYLAVALILQHPSTHLHGHLEMLRYEHC